MTSLTGVNVIQVSTSTFNRESCANEMNSTIKVCYDQLTEDFKY